MPYDITTQTIEPTTLLYQPARCEHGQVAETLGRILPAVFACATQHGLAMVGPPTAVYVQWGPGVVTLYAGLPVAPGSRGRDGVEVAVLESSLAAVTMHTGPYDGLGDAHAAVEQFLHRSELESRGPQREVYLTDPGEVPDPKDWKTQIIWPVNG